MGSRDLLVVFRFPAGTGALFRGIRRSGREANHVVADVKNAWVCTSTAARACHVVRRSCSRNMAT
jgi:hypothetical protein